MIYELGRGSFQEAGIEVFENLGRLIFDFVEERGGRADPIEHSFETDQFQLHAFALRRFL